MLHPELPLFEKSGLTDFQNYLLSLTKEGFSLLKQFFTIIFAIIFCMVSMTCPFFFKNKHFP